jgi:hypothetical protein
LFEVGNDEIVIFPAIFPNEYFRFYPPAIDSIKWPFFDPRENVGLRIADQLDISDL